MKAVLVVGVAAAALAAGCSAGTEVEQRSAVEHGRDLFESTKTSNSSRNTFTCATCHQAAPDSADTRILPGFVLAGAVDRPTFWGGQRLDLLTAINDCRYFFMGALIAWKADDEDAKAMYAYLASLPRTQPAALPFTPVQVAADVPAGDKAAGEAVYERACRACHGAVHTGRGRLRSDITVLPDAEVDYLKSSFGFDPIQTRLTFIEKVRHGAFLGVFGNMPLYSTEAMSDADLGALLAFFGLY